MAARPRIEPWPLALGLLLAAGIAASLAFYAVAVARPDLEVVEDAYYAGLRYNEELRARERGAALGLELELVARPREGGLVVEVVVRDARGRPAAVESVSVRRERPAEGGLDAEFSLVPAGEGFRGDVPLPRPGRWRLVAAARVAGERIERVFSVSAGR